MIRQDEAVVVAKELDEALRDIANGRKKAKDLPLEPLAKLVAFAKFPIPASVISDEQRAELHDLMMPVIKWLNENMHPHAKIIVEPTSYELVEGVTALHTEDFVKG